MGLAHEGGAGPGDGGEDEEGGEDAGGEPVEEEDDVDDVEVEADAESEKLHSGWRETTEAALLVTEPRPQLL